MATWLDLLLNNPLNFADNTHPMEVGTGATLLYALYREAFLFAVLPLFVHRTSSEVIAYAVNSVAMKYKNRVQYILEMKPLYLRPDFIYHCVGAICNEDNNHWVAIKAIDDKIWYIDSRYQPRQMSKDEYLEYINKRRGAYPIRLAEEMSDSLQSTAIGSASSSLSFSDSQQSPVLPLTAASQQTDSQASSSDEPPTKKAKQIEQETESPWKRARVDEIPAGESNVPVLMVQHPSEQQTDPN